MRCDICGTEYFGSGACPGCGYYARKEGRTDAPPLDHQMPVTGASGQLGGSSPLLNSYYRTTTHTPAQLKKASRIVAAAVIIFGIVMIILFIAFRVDFNYDFGSFTMDLPNSMKKNEASKFVSYYQVHGFDSGEYTNRNVTFAYVVIDDPINTYGTETTESMIDVVYDSFEDADGYEYISRSGDTLKFRMTSEGTLLYTQLRVTFENDRLYYLILACKDNLRSRYESKFDKYMASFKTK